MPPPSVQHFSSLERVALQKTNYMYTSPSPVLKQLYITAKWTKTIYLSILVRYYICRPPIHTNFNLVVHCSSVLYTPSLFFFFFFFLFFLFTTYKSQSACSFQSAKRIWSNAYNIFNKITLYIYIYRVTYTCFGYTLYRVFTHPRGLV